MLMRMMQSGCREDLNISDKMNDVLIRPVEQYELIDLQEISRQTFVETFAAQNTEENMKKYLEENLSAEKLSAELHDNNSRFYFAELDKKVIGYLKLNFGQSQTELKDGRALEIERIYVIREFQGMRIGQKLYDKAINIARDEGMDYVWLGVWEENPKAISFYRKNGFVEFDRHIFRLGDDNQTDIMMKLELK